MYSTKIIWSGNKPLSLRSKRMATNRAVRGEQKLFQNPQRRLFFLFPTPLGIKPFLLATVLRFCPFHQMKILTTAFFHQQRLLLRKTHLYNGKTILFCLNILRTLAKFIQANIQPAFQLIEF